MIYAYAPKHLLLCAYLNNIHQSKALFMPVNFKSMLNYSQLEVLDVFPLKTTR